MTDFRDVTGSPPTFIQGTPVTINIEADVENQGVTDDDILPVTGAGDVNYVLELVFTDADIQSGTDTLGESAVSVTITSDAQQGLESSTSITLTGTADVTMSTTNCPDVQFLCVKLSAASSSSYIDGDPSYSSNGGCFDVTSRMQCQTGLYTTIFRHMPV